VFPKFKLYANFDNGDAGTELGSYRVAYDMNDVFDQAEQDAFNEFANSWRFFGDGTPQPPAAPNDLTATVTSGDVLLGWSASDGDLDVDSYDVYRDGTKVANTPDLSWTDTSADQGATYTYTVRAVDTAGQSSGESDPATVAVPDTTAPSRPTGLAASLSAGLPRLTWRAATDNVGVTGYEVLRNGVPVGTTTGLAFVDVGAPQSTTHTYTVRSRDLAGNASAVSTSVRRSVPDSTAPSSPGNLRVTRARTSATLTWTAATDNVGVTGYIVYRGTTVVSRPAASARRVTVSGLRAGTQYDFRVVARDRAGNTGPAASARG